MGDTDTIRDALNAATFPDEHASGSHMRVTTLRALAAAERFIAAWDHSYEVGVAHANSGYIRATPEQRREVDEASEELMAARAALTTPEGKAEDD